MVDVGDPAPGFELRGVEDDTIQAYSLDELTAGSALVMGVYAYDFSPICTKQICDIAEYEWLRLHDNVNVVCISGDGPYAHKEFAKAEDIYYPLLSDTDRSVCERYGVLDDSKNGLKRVPRRSLFLISPDQRIEFKWVAGDNWDDWEEGPLVEVNDAIQRLDLPD